MNNYIIANRTDVGRARQVNEDNMTTFDSPNGRVIAVCDGMGGQAAGDVASQLACDIIRDILENNTFNDPNEAITRAIMAANQAILHRASQDPSLEGMGATCVMLIIKNGLVYYGWVGDSRIYMLEDHKLVQVSRDQSYVQMLVDQGEITAEEAENHPQKNEITNALGLQGMTPPLLCGDPVEPKPGMMFMLCSDGLTNMVGAQQIERELNKTDLSLQEKAAKLIFLANQYGGADNITVQLVEFGTPKAAHAAKAPLQANAPQSPISRIQAPNDKKGGSNKAMLIAICVCLLVILCAAGTYLFLSNGSDNDASAIENINTTETKKPQSTKRNVSNDAPAKNTQTQQPTAQPKQEKTAPETPAPKPSTKKEEKSDLDNVKGKTIKTDGKAVKDKAQGTTTDEKKESISPSSEDL